MRKKLREMTDRASLLALLDGCDVCRIALCDQDRPYIVPVNFGYDWLESGLVLYVHGAMEGRKIDIIRQNNQVCFEMDWRHELKLADLACDCSMNYESLIGEGSIEILIEKDEKRYGLDRIMAHYGRTDCTYDDSILERTCVLRLHADQVTGKRLAK
jgi:hypothetical protein